MIISLLKRLESHAVDHPAPQLVIQTRRRVISAEHVDVWCVPARDRSHRTACLGNMRHDKSLRSETRLHIGRQMKIGSGGKPVYAAVPRRIDLGLHLAVGARLAAKRHPCGTLGDLEVRRIDFIGEIWKQCVALGRRQRI